MPLAFVIVGKRLIIPDYPKEALGVLVSKDNFLFTCLQRRERAEQSKSTERSEEREGGNARKQQTQQIYMPNMSAGLEKEARGGGEDVGVTEPTLCVMIIHLEGYQF